MKSALSFLAASLLLLTTCAAHADAAWPDRYITLVVPYAPGGYTDAVGRITARFLEKKLGVSVVVENRDGAGGLIGTQYVARAKPDGYTLCMCSVGAVSVAPVAQKVGYDPKRDLLPISIVSVLPQTVIVQPSLPIHSMAELISYAKEHPGQLNYGSSGVAGLMHYSVALFEVRTGTKMAHIPYKGGAPATMAVVSGEIQLSFTNMTDAIPQIRGGTVRGIAVTSKVRSPFLPDLPTVEEAANLKDFSAESWNGVIAPPGTPASIVARLSDAFVQMAEDPDVKTSMSVVGATTAFTTPDAFAKRIADELAQWTDLVAEIGKTNL
jgi:tripartite-type tricarboxylate transporter receptor subunit TctC